MNTQYRTEAHRQRIEHHLDEPTQYADGPRARLLRELQGAWRHDHAPQTLRAEIEARERGPRQLLLHELRNSHMADADARNRIGDAMDGAGLTPREKLAVQVNEMWKTKS